MLGDLLDLGGGGVAAGTGGVAAGTGSEPVAFGLDDLFSGVTDVAYLGGAAPPTPAPKVASDDLLGLSFDSLAPSAPAPVTSASKAPAPNPTAAALDDLFG
eukprot:NODE_24146_length_637_cov_1.249020.p1 GENE.NODE_24146_length_637_cov_1.249020~~NODE_24146_length_637_cov_1.249020.p1  ORF type:complete len:101 (+),score=40.40 NODE_24146_length_637_cov_1.249020:328-630(+)